MTDDAWTPLFSVDTPYAALDGIVREQTAIALDDVRAQLQAAPAFTERQRAAALVLAEPIIAARWRDVVERVWLSLQCEAGRVPGA